MKSEKVLTCKYDEKKVLTYSSNELLLSQTGRKIVFPPLTTHEEKIMKDKQVEIGHVEVKPIIELLGKMGKSILVRFSHHGEYYINVKISNKSTMKEIASLYETLTGDELENIN